jgi:hypothetical protein
MLNSKAFVFIETKEDFLSHWSRELEYLLYAALNAFTNMEKPY